QFLEVHFMKSIVIYILLIPIFFSCQQKETIISSNSLNKADGIYKIKEVPFTGKALDTTGSGRVILTFNWLNGKLDGKYLKYYRESGNLEYKKTFENGYSNGEYLNLAENGDTITYGN